MAKAWLVVRAEVAQPDRAAFEDWYARDHLPLAVKTFGAARGWRAWSYTDPAIHYAYYEFADVEAARAATRPDRITPLVADFDRVWGTRVTRRRELLELIQEING